MPESKRSSRKYLFAALLILAGLLVFWLSREKLSALVVSENPPAVKNAEILVHPTVSAPSSSAPIPEISPVQIEKARSQAKVALSMAYGAQKSYFGEFDRYSTDLKAVGLQPPDAVMKFKMGFLTAYTPPKLQESASFREDPRRLDSDAYLGAREESSGTQYTYAPPAEGLRLADYEQYCQRGCTADDKHFEYMVVLPLDDKGHVDVWVINDKKEVKMVLDGRAKN